jgi:hypothetical protein
MLFSLKKEHSGFMVPDGYFQGFPDRLSTLVLLRKTEDFKVPEHYFENLPEHLKVLTLEEKAKAPFHVPEGYFEKLPRRLQDRVHPNQVHPRSFFLPRLALPAMAAAAGIALLVGIFFSIRQESSEPQTAMNMSHLNHEEVESNLLENVDESFLIEQAENTQDHESAEQDAIGEYLIENQVDLNTLVNEL